MKFRYLTLVATLFLPLPAMSQPVVGGGTGPDAVIVDVPGTAPALRFVRPEPEPETGCFAGIKRCFTCCISTVRNNKAAMNAFLTTVETVVDLTGLDDDTKASIKKGLETARGVVKHSNTTLEVAFDEDGQFRGIGTTAGGLVAEFGDPALALLDKKVTDPNGRAAARFMLNLVKAGSDGVIDMKERVELVRFVTNHFNDQTTDQIKIVEKDGQFVFQLYANPEARDNGRTAPVASIPLLGMDSIKGLNVRELLGVFNKSWGAGSRVEGAGAATLTADETSRLTALKAAFGMAEDGSVATAHRDTHLEVPVAPPVTAAGVGGDT